MARKGSPRSVVKLSPDAIDEITTLASKECRNQCRAASASINRLTTTKFVRYCTMTKAQKLLNKFPKMEHNENVLTDVACPKCGGRECFKIAYSTMGCFGDDGEEEKEGDNEWTGRSYIECRNGACCGHFGTVAGFTFKGLDELIEAPHCETCGKAYPEGGDGWAGECPACADKTAAADEADHVTSSPL